MDSLRPAVDYPTGQVVNWTFESALLADNPLGDPAIRAHPIYLPPGYGTDPSKRYPVLWVLAAYTNAGPGQVAWRNHGETVPQRLDRLIADGAIPPMMAVFPDCYTSLGGNQYVDSPALGPYAKHIVDELIPAVDAEFQTLASPSARAVLGKSSGGFGALHLAMSHPGVFSGVASHAGDCGFDRIYPRDFPVACDVIGRHQGDLAQLVRKFWRSKRPGHAEFHAMMVLCLAASYSPEADKPLGLALPFDWRTCERVDDVWARWMRFDPVNRIQDAAPVLKALAGLWIDVGFRDQYFMHYGARSLHQALQDSGIEHAYEEFDGTHSGIDWRLDLSMTYLAERLSHE
mgnify:CR=1 FL=1